MLNAIIVDDEIGIREGIKLMLPWKTYGINHPACFANGILAMEEIEKNNPDLCIVDIRMPVISGLDLIQRAREAGYDTTFVVLSGHDDFSYAQQSIELGVFRYLLKAVNTDELRDVVSSAVKYVKRKLTQKVYADKYKSMVLEGRSTSNDDSLEHISIRRDGIEIMLHDIRVKQIIQHINTYISQELSLVSLAKVVFLHPNYLSNLFKNETGESLIDYITRVRMEYAKELLLTNLYTVKQITEKTGYNDPRYFAKIFNKTTGVLPSQYRSQSDREKK